MTLSCAAMQDQGARSLSSVLEILPAECYENPTWKGLAYLARDFGLYAAIVAALFWVDQWWLLLPLWALAGLAVSGLFILGHAPRYHELQCG